MLGFIGAPLKRDPKQLIFFSFDEEVSKANENYLALTIKITRTLRLQNAMDPFNRSFLELGTINIPSARSWRTHLAPSEPLLGVPTPLPAQSSPRLVDFRGGAVPGAASQGFSKQPLLSKGRTAGAGSPRAVRQLRWHARQKWQWLSIVGTRLCAWCESGDPSRDDLSGATTPFREQHKQRHLHRPQVTSMREDAVVALLTLPPFSL